MRTNPFWVIAGCISNPVEHLWCSFFATIVNGCFCKNTSSWLFEWFLKTPLNWTGCNIRYDFHPDLEEVKENLNQDLLKIFELFYENCMILNPGKCYYMCLGRDAVGDLVRFCGDEIKSSKFETVLEIENYNKLNLGNPIKTLYIKASEKFGAW